jgi:hypothetical protein
METLAEEMHLDVEDVPLVEFVPLEKDRSPGVVRYSKM